MKSYYINGEFPHLEAKTLQLWQKFCLKTEPLPELGGKTLSEKLSFANSYWIENFRGNLCCYDGNVDKFVIYAFGPTWFTASHQAKKEIGPNVVVLVMGASFNKSLAEIRESFEWLKDTFVFVKKEKNVQKIVWNANRQNKRQPFLRLLERFGENKGEYWQAF